VQAHSPTRLQGLLRAQRPVAAAPRHVAAGGCSPKACQGARGDGGGGLWRTAAAADLHVTGMAGCQDVRKGREMTRQISWGEGGELFPATSAAAVAAATAAAAAAETAASAAAARLECSSEQASPSPLLSNPLPHLVVPEAGALHKGPPCAGVEAGAGACGSRAEGGPPRAVQAFGAQLVWRACALPELLQRPGA